MESIFMSINRSTLTFRKFFGSSIEAMMTVCIAVCEQRVLKAIPTEPSPTLVEISLTKERLQIKILAGGQGTHRQNIVQYVAEWFDLHRDLNEFYNLGNAGLRQLIREFAGLRIVGIPDLFEALCWSIIGQQINLSFAYRIKRNLVEFSGEFIHYEGQKHFLFPTPAKVMEISEATLRDMKFSPTENLLYQISR